MAQYRKLKPSRCEKDMYIVVHAPNVGLTDEAGHLCKVTSVNKTVGICVLSTGKQFYIKLEDESTWAYDPTTTDTLVMTRIADKKAFPGFSPRMEKEGWDGKKFLLKTEEIVFDNKEGSPGNGKYFIRHTGETKKEDGSFYRNLFLMSDIYMAEPPEWRQSRAERMGADVVELPLPPKPVLAEHEEAIKAITPWLVELNKGLRSENVSHGKCTADFKQKVLYKDTVCHRDVQSDCGFEVGYVFTIGLNRLKEGNWNKGHCSDEAMRLWITYLTGYSPYADAFITKDPDYILKHGYILKGDAPSRIVVGAMFATRQVWEKAARAEAFLELYKAGMSLDEAFLFGCQCSVFKNGKMKMGQEGSGHSHLYNGKLTDECIINFLDHKPGVKDEPFCKNWKPSGSKGGIDGMWSTSFGKKPPASIVTKLFALKKAGNAMDNSLPVDDCVEQIIEMVQDWRQDNNI